MDAQALLNVRSSQMIKVPESNVPVMSHIKINETNTSIGMYVFMYVCMYVCMYVLCVCLCSCATVREYIWFGCYCGGFGCFGVICAVSTDRK